jgi:hypothetical protein
MHQLLNKTKRTSRMNAMLIAAFGLLLWLPAADNLLHLDHASAFNEKRAPAAFPTFNGGLAGLQNYVSGMEAYFNDHFGWRKQLIRWHGSLEVAVFGKKTGNEVVWGKDGWLYYYPPRRGDDPRSRGPRGFSPQELETLRQTLECRRDWLACHGIRYLFVVAPSKQTIYPEYLPSWLKPSSSPARLDQFLAYMRSHSSVAILDLRQPLREAKRLAPTYYRTDSHWNSFGGFIASAEIVRALSTEMPRLRPMPLEAFRLTRSPARGGDLADLLGICAEDEQVNLVPDPTLPGVSETVQNPGFVKPNFVSTNGCADGTAVIFRDSFGTALRPFLGYSFRNLSYIWNARDFDPALVEEIQPDVVISEIAERNLDGLAPWQRN